MDKIFIGLYSYTIYEADGTEIHRCSSCLGSAQSQKAYEQGMVLEKILPNTEGKKFEIHTVQAEELTEENLAEYGYIPAPTKASVMQELIDEIVGFVAIAVQARGNVEFTKDQIKDIRFSPIHRIVECQIDTETPDYISFTYEELGIS